MKPKPLSSLNHLTVPVVRIAYSYWFPNCRSAPLRVCCIIRIFRPLAFAGSPPASGLPRTRGTVRSDPLWTGSSSRVGELTGLYLIPWGACQRVVGVSDEAHVQRSGRRCGGAAGRQPASDPVGPVTQQVAALPIGDMADRLCESERQASWVELWESLCDRLKRCPAQTRSGRSSTVGSMTWSRTPPREFRGTTWSPLPGKPRSRPAAPGPCSAPRHRRPLAPSPQPGDVPPVARPAW